MRRAMFRTAMTLAGLLAVAGAGAQETKPAVGSKDAGKEKLTQPVDKGKGGEVLTMEITNGPTTTRHFFTEKKGRLESDALARLEMAQNEMTYVKQLLALREKYASDALAGRSGVRQDYVNTTIGTDLSYGPLPVFYGNPPIATFFLPNNPMAFSFPIGPTFGGYSGVQTIQSVSTRSGEESKLSAEMAKAMAKQATPDYLAKVTSEYQEALAAADRFPEFRAALGLPSDGIRQASPTPGDKTDASKPATVKTATPAPTKK